MDTTSFLKSSIRLSIIGRLIAQPSNYLGLIFKNHKTTSSVPAFFGKLSKSLFGPQEIDIHKSGSSSKLHVKLKTMHKRIHVFPKRFSLFSFLA